LHLCAEYVRSALLGGVVVGEFAVAVPDEPSVLMPRREISLHVRRGPLRGSFFPTSWCDLLLIGRAPSNHIVLPHPQTSAHHCLLVRLRPGIRFLLIDARSRHGTRVNGERVSHAIVVPGDAIAVGAFELGLVDRVSAQRPPYALRPMASRPPVFALAPRRKGGEAVPLPAASATVIGRDPLAHLRVKDDAVSDFHCLVATQPHDDGRAPVVVDLWSGNGTFVKTLAVHRKRLHPGNLLTIGRTQLVLRRAAEVQPPASAPVRVTPSAPRPGVPVPSARPHAARSRRHRGAGPLA